ncbi:MAG: flagellar basal body-associated FliL family protein [Polyangiaceae bacterium]|nr:flagellar basal body-associated FliL family protein [Polyangiaceae bacterium]
MAEEKKEEEKKTEAKPPKASKGPLVLTLVGILATGGASGAASFFGAKKGQKSTIEVKCTGESESGGHHGGGDGHEAPPGPTLSLEPFIINPTDKAGKYHAAKLTIAIEFTATTKEESLKPLIPRMRDAILSFLRTLNFEEVADQAHLDKARKELLEKLMDAGVNGVKRVLLTDLVVQ